MSKKSLKKLADNQRLLKDVLGESLFNKLSVSGKDIETAIKTIHHEMDRIAA